LSFTPAFLYMGWKCVFDNPASVLKGWDACGLLTPFKPDLREAALEKACAAAVLEHHPLFPKTIPTTAEPEPREYDMDPSLECQAA
jgi:hypothetical protein